MSGGFAADVLHAFISNQDGQRKPEPTRPIDSSTPNPFAATTAPPTVPEAIAPTAQTSGFVDADKGAPTTSPPRAPSVHFAPSASPTGRSPDAPPTAVAHHGGFTALPTNPIGGFQTIIPPTAGGGGLGGGLASSPNVPRPGTSIDPKTGKPYTAGLTRAELDAIKAKGAGLLEQTPQPQTQTEQVRRSSAASSGSTSTDEAFKKYWEGRRASEVSGREQAARQLAGTAPTTGESTPGLELPGGWGATKQTAFSGSGQPNAPTSVYEDIGEGLEKIGATAFNLIPKGVREALSGDLIHPDKGKQPEGQPPKARRTSVGTLFEQAKQQGEKLVHEVQETIVQGQRRASTSIQSDTGVIAKVKQFLAETDAVSGPVAVKAAALPSQEFLGARPGDRSDGVGALPGRSTESGVAVLPDEKKAPTSLPSQENQGMRPGEVSAGVGALPGKGTESGVAVLPDQKAAEGTAGALVTTGTPGTATPPADTSGRGTSEAAAGASVDPSAAAFLTGSSPLTVTDIPAAPASTTQATSAPVVDKSIPEPSASVPSAVAGARDPSAAAFLATSTPDSKLDNSASAPLSSTADSSDPSAAAFLATSDPKAEATSAAPASPTSRSSSLPKGTYNGPALGGLATALPATSVGYGAAKGATDVETTGLKEVTPVDYHETTSPVPASQPAPSASVDHGSTLSPSSAVAPDTRHAQDRTTSSASITAIRHGNEGSRFGLSHLNESTIAENTIPERPAGEATAAATAATAPAAAAAIGEHTVGDHTRANGHSSNTKSLTPGNETEGIGHPDSRGTGTTREPGAYPKADHYGQAVDQHGHAVGPKHTDTTSAGTANQGTSATGVGAIDNSGKDGGLGAAGTIPASSSEPSERTTPSSSVTPQSPSTQLGNGNRPKSSLTTSSGTPASPSYEKGHARTGSNLSTGSNGKKKVGFMQKLKGEMKVIGGKLGNDDKKVQEGEKLKHGG